MPVLHFLHVDIAHARDEVVPRPRQAPLYHDAKAWPANPQDLSPAFRISEGAIDKARTRRRIRDIRRSLWIPELTMQEAEVNMTGTYRSVAIGSQENVSQRDPTR